MSLWSVCASKLLFCVWNWFIYAMIEGNTVLQFIVTRSLLSAFFWNVWLWSVSQSRRMQSSWSPLSEPQISCVIYRYYSCILLICYVSKKENLWFILVGVHATLVFFDSIVWGPALGLWRMLLCSALCVYLLCAYVYNAHMHFYKLHSCAIYVTKLYRKAWQNCCGWEETVHINFISKVISLLKWFYSSCDSSVLCMNMLHHNVLFISLGTDPL